MAYFNNSSYIRVSEVFMDFYGTYDIYNYFVSSLINLIENSVSNVTIQCNRKKWQIRLPELQEETKRQHNPFSPNEVAIPTYILPKLPEEEAGLLRCRSTWWRHWRLFIVLLKWRIQSAFSPLTRCEPKECSGHLFSLFLKFIIKPWATRKLRAAFSSVFFIFKIHCEAKGNIWQRINKL